LFCDCCFTGSTGGNSAGRVLPYFKPNDEVVPAFAEGELVLVVEGEKVLSKNSPKILEGEVLLPFDIVKEYFDPHIFWDEALGKVTITTKDRVIRMKTDKLDAIVNNQPITLNIPVTVENDVVYIPIEFLAEFTVLKCHTLKRAMSLLLTIKTA